MVDKINEDIRFYLPADPYYYQVDNLPLEDLLGNDKILQDQIDELRNAEMGVTVGRQGLLELQPYVDTAIPGTISVRPGNFIGRVQRTAGSDVDGTNVERMNQGIFEMGDPPTDPQNDNYNVHNPPSPGSDPADYVGRTSVFNYMGGSVAIDSFDYNDFDQGGFTTAPLGRLDLVGITTVNGAMDDPFLPGNDTGGALTVGDGFPKLAVVKGAGITTANNGVRQLVIGEKYITVGTPQENINEYGRDIEGNVVPNPTFGTIPAPDDVVNICFGQADAAAALRDFAQNNRNASFFLPIAYVYVPQSHVAGNPIAPTFVKDIRPIFRTAELSLAERQALAHSQRPGIRNPVITTSRLEQRLIEDVNKTVGLNSLQQQVDDLRNATNTITTLRYQPITQYTIINGGVGGSTSSPNKINITLPIKPEHRNKTITAINYWIRPRGATGDIGGGWIGLMRGDNMNPQSHHWAMNWGNRVRHSSSIIAQAVEFLYPPSTEAGGNFYMYTMRSGTSQHVYWYVRGYFYEDTVTI